MTDVTLTERVLIKGFSFIMGNTKYPCVSRRTKLPGSGVHSEVTERGRR